MIRRKGRSPTPHPARAPNHRPHHQPDRQPHHRPDRRQGRRRNVMRQSDDHARLLTRHEGRRTHPYLDTTGRLTIGVGRNLTDRGLAGDEIDLLLANDIALARSICGDQFGAAFHAASTARQQALISMAFNLRLNAIEIRACWRAVDACLLYTSPSPRDRTRYRMPSSA